MAVPGKESCAEMTFEWGWGPPYGGRFYCRGCFGGVAQRHIELFEHLFFGHACPLVVKIPILLCGLDLSEFVHPPVVRRFYAWPPVLFAGLLTPQHLVLDRSEWSICCCV